MLSRSQNFYRFSLAVFDIIGINLSYMILMDFMARINQSVDYIIFAFAVNLCWISCSYLTALYLGKHQSRANFFKRSLKTYSLFFTVLLLFIFLYGFDYSRLFVLLTLLIFLLLIILSRTILIAAGFVQHQYQVQKSIVIIGCNDLSKKLVENFAIHQRTIRIVGCFHDSGELAAIAGVPTLGKVEECLSYALENNVSEIYSTISPEITNSIYSMAEEAEKNFIRFKFVPDFRIFVNRKMHLELDRDLPILSLRPDHLEEIGNRFKKRLFDIFFSLMIIVFVLSWLLPIISIIIKFDSKGPVFFKQLRSGKNNKPFVCLKFRTLKPNQVEARQVTKDDDRFTRVGRFLRKTSIDELPQFFNVLYNSMSVVGPRPHMLQHTIDFSKIFKQYMVRQYIKPGITGWAQVNGYRGEVRNENSLINRIQHDIWYIENWSMWLDCRIILVSVIKTVIVDKNAV